MSNLDDNGNGKTTSRLKKHLAILGLLPKAEQPTESALTAERNLIDSVGDLPELEFDETSNDRGDFEIRRTRRAIWTGAIALAAAISLMIVVQNRDDEPDFRIKGDLGSARVYVETNGKVQEFNNDLVIVDGTKVRIQIIALKDLQAVLVLLDSKQSVDLETFKASPTLSLKAGETKVFPGSLELFGNNDHETVLTVLCPTGTPVPSLAGDWIDAFNARKPPASSHGCQFSYVQLR